MTLEDMADGLRQISKMLCISVKEAYENHTAQELKGLYSLEEVLAYIGKEEKEKGTK